jgi:outer membrane protein assembly factor BamE (lipoprotein component of BamABCDE complex)
MPRYLPAPVLAAAAAAPLLLGSCLFGAETDITTTGRYVSEETLSRIQPGESQEFVASLLGAPSEKIPSATGNEIWRWAYSATTTEKGGIFLIARTQKTTAESGTTFVEFSEGKVVRTWRD